MITGTGIVETKEEKVAFNEKDARKKLKQKVPFIRLAISIKNKKLTGDYFARVVRLFNEAHNFASVKILDTTYLNRHYDDEYGKITEGVKSPWEIANASIIEKLKPQHSIESWEGKEIFRHAEFKSLSEVVRVKFEGDRSGNGIDPDFAKLVDKEAKTHTGKASLKKRIDYLLEEVTGILLMDGLVAYPGRFNPAVRHAIKNKFGGKKGPGLLRYEFKEDHEARQKQNSAAHIESSEVKAMTAQGTILGTPSDIDDDTRTDPEPTNSVQKASPQPRADQSTAESSETKSGSGEPKKNEFAELSETLELANETLHPEQLADAAKSGLMILKMLTRAKKTSPPNSVSSAPAALPLGRNTTPPNLQGMPTLSTGDKIPPTTQNSGPKAPTSAGNVSRSTSMEALAKLSLTDSTKAEIKLAPLPAAARTIVTAAPKADNSPKSSPDNSPPPQDGSPQPQSPGVTRSWPKPAADKKEVAHLAKGSPIRTDKPKSDSGSNSGGASRPTVSSAAKAASAGRSKKPIKVITSSSSSNAALLLQNRNG